MEITTGKVELLLVELEAKISALRTNSDPDINWTQWKVVSQELREHLLGQLSACDGKFNSDIYSVGTLSSHEDIQACIQQAQDKG